MNNTPTQFLSATPVLASLDIERSVEFFVSKLGFTSVHVVQGEYGIVSNGAVSIHFWACTDRRIAEATGCRVRVEGVQALYARCSSQAIVHPNAPLDVKPWGSQEFAILDPDGNLVTFHENTPA
jgi:catechol 2,3-dioxygenase-like lactoylglutathione lyase family enzyme